MTIKVRVAKIAHPALRPKEAMYSPSTRAYPHVKKADGLADLRLAGALLLGLQGLQQLRFNFDLLTVVLKR
jgi:hypothetical protein